MSNITIAELIKFNLAKFSFTDITVKSDIQDIFCDVLHVNRTYLYLHSDKVLEKSHISDINIKIHRLISGEPLAYILGYKYFWNQKLKVTKDTLIPRADTETLVQAVLDSIKDKNSEIKILDLGTGTGAIALALAGEFKNSQILATDISQESLKIATANANLNNITNIEFVKSDWYQSLDDSVFDIIVSNPPYIAFDDKNISHEVKKYEPQTALFAENNGLKDIETIVSGAKNFLKSNGQVFIEHGFTQSKEVQSIFLKNDFTSVKTIKDLNGKDRCTKASI